MEKPIVYKPLLFLPLYGGYSKDENTSARFFDDFFNFCEQQGRPDVKE